MKWRLNEDKDTVLTIYEALSKNDFYCPCALIKDEDTKCACKEFREEVKVGDYCTCGLYLKEEV